MAPERTAERRATKSGSQRRLWYTVSIRPDPELAASILETSSERSANGFSQTTCFPASRHSRTAEACSAGGTPTTTRSTEGSDRRSAAAAWVGTSKRSAAERRWGELSQMPAARGPRWRRSEERRVGKEGRAGWGGEQ